MIMLPHPPAGLAWNEAGDLAGLPGDAYKETARSGRDQLAVRLLQAVERLRCRQAAAQFLAAAGARQ